MKTISELQKEVHDNAVAKGWYEKEKSVSEHLALIHSEVSEALEADRNDVAIGVGSVVVEIMEDDDSDFKQEFEE